MKVVRVVLADDHALVRAGLKALLRAHDVEVVAEAENGRELLRQVRNHRPDLALVDISMPSLDGFEAARRIPALSPETRVVILSMHDDENYVDRARQCGAWAFLSKDEDPEFLVRVLRRVVRGERLLDAWEGEEELTSREREVLHLIAEGKRNAEIAEVMCRSIHTVRNHRARLMRKLGARTAPELVSIAQSRGLLHLPASRGEAS